eukprot:765772-Hanusia_phi.AAC.2
MAGRRRGRARESGGSEAPPAVRLEQGREGEEEEMQEQEEEVGRSRRGWEEERKSRSRKKRWEEEQEETDQFKVERLDVGPPCKERGEGTKAARAEDRNFQLGCSPVLQQSPTSPRASLLCVDVLQTCSPQDGRGFDSTCNSSSSIPPLPLSCTLSVSLNPCP